MVTSISIIMLAILYWITAFFSEKKSIHAKLIHEFSKSAFMTLGFGFIVFSFKKPLYRYLLRPEIEVSLDKDSCEIVNDFNKVWVCKIDFANPSDSHIKGRIYKAQSDNKDYNFEKCLLPDSSTSGIKLTEEKESFCKYKVTIEPNGEEALRLEISAGEAPPQIDFKEMIL